MIGLELTLGIDEAGRGPALGPMVLAAVLVDADQGRRLAEAGLADSKAFGSGAKAHARRQELAQIVNEVATHVAVRVVEVSTIDERVARGELNELEREVARTLIDASPAAELIFCDGERMFAPLKESYRHLVAENKAESKHIAVAAASVIAKTRRDELFAQMRARYEPEFGPLTGGGYVNNGTRAFLRAYALRHRCLPPEARRSWPHPYLDDLLSQQELDKA